MKKSTTGLMLALGAVFLCTPFYLNASAPRTPGALTTSSRVTQGSVGKVRVAARLQTDASGRVKVLLTATNPTDRPATARIRVDVFERPQVSRFARMAPMPRMRGNATLQVRLKPRERLVKTLPVQDLGGKPAHIAKRQLAMTYLVVRPSPKARTRVKAHAQRTTHAPAKAQAVAAR